MKYNASPSARRVVLLLSAHFLKSMSARTSRATARIINEKNAHLSVDSVIID